MTGPFPVEYVLTFSDGRLDTAAIAKRADDLAKLPSGGHYEYHGSGRVARFTYPTPQEAAKAALDEAHEERERNARHAAVNLALSATNAAAELQRRCDHMAAERIAETEGREVIEFQIRRRRVGSLPGLDVYERALELQQTRHLQAAE